MAIGERQQAVAQRGPEPGQRLRLAIWILASGLFLLPLVAMQFTDQVTWTRFDFLAWGAMLLVAAGAYELLSRISSSRAYRLGAGLAIVTAFLVVWANGAVGMIGNEGNAYNLLFLGAIAIGVVIALALRFAPGAMVYALCATAGAHALVAAIALVAGWDMRGAALALCFALPYLLAAGLFRMAARKQSLAAGP